MACKVFNLTCASDHHFEGWFASQEDHQRQAASGLLECPLCGSKDVRRAPSAPYVKVHAPAQRLPSTGPAGPSNEQVQAMLVKLTREVLAASEDVGDRFAEEARRIHYDEAPERSIRGVATREQAAALGDEGIAVVQLPLGSLFKESLH